MRRTKIICTLGPATEKIETLRGLMRAGADVFRFNMSHAEHDWAREVVGRIRKLERELERPVAILFDTQGPAIRTGALPNELELKPGDFLELTVRGAPAKEKYSVSVNYDGLINDVSVGDTVLVDSGVIQLVVVGKGRDRLRCRVVIGGTLRSHRHINLPGVHVKLPALTEKDLHDIDLAVALEADFVALSFARKEGDIEELRRVLRRKNSPASIIAKIEEQSAVKQIDEMIEAADAIMVARGDLGIEIPMEELPIIQRRIVKRCIRLGKPVIVATHMLESMIENPVPTRAEITDIANAVFEQADAIMLSAETTMGRYPVECVKVFDRVARRIERSGGAGFARDVILVDARQKTVASAVVLANSLANAKLIVFTRQGTRPRSVSNMRPEHAPIFAFTPNEIVKRRLVLYWGTFPLHLDFAKDPDQTITRAEKFLRDARLTRKGDNLVIISDARAKGGVIDSVQLRNVE
jgi:pyruvate kinase